MTTGELHIGSAAIASRDILPDLYERNRFEPLWRNPVNEKDLIAEISNIAGDGLNPEDYHLSDLLLARLHLDEAGGANGTLLADYDLLLTDSLILLCYHLLFGKVDPEDLDPDWNMSREVSNSDPVAAILRRLETGTLAEGLRNIRPRYTPYGQLTAALAQYRAIQEAGGWVWVPNGPTLKPGMSDERISALRRRLAATEDYPGPPSDGILFDGSLEQAVRRFQSRHLLKADGVVGEKTLAALQVSVKQRVDQIRVNLERARWVLHKLPPAYLLVDIAGFTIYYYLNDAVAWSSRIQVGQPYRHTPVFKSAIKYIVINPSWVVPPTILRKDILPKLRRDPGYLQKMKIRVIDRDGGELDPRSIDWSQFRSRQIPYTLKQDPGPHNALGRMKFIFPNKHFVYLHDTASTNLFEKEERTFSSGCIRVEKYLELAQILLDDPAKWGRDQIQAVIDTQATRQVTLAAKMPIILIYTTVSIDQNGAVIFKNDIYDRDRAVLEGLNERFGIWQRMRFKQSKRLPPQAGEPLLGWPVEPVARAVLSPPSSWSHPGSRRLSCFSLLDAPSAELRMVNLPNHG